ncbi:hypothetical protein [Pseudoalteromonas denitrificans]|uniref:Uncharacterized protein n=1 Tax=Pseudoalteromonas denitrificans DSM 6059 TaxID=1123010 RepID=A0A1I1Q512_9GAMM|nr:hypothetical protein [Pseudoalteromonas denitrificans]SFD17105.1 hypothetical protein SAMN02745724_03740 [Pseudoalteromonas denitrificans DSM 6059]
MTINRSAMLQAIKLQLETSLKDKAQVLLLATDKPIETQAKVLIKLLQEDVLFTDSNSDHKDGKKNNQILVPQSNLNDQRALHLVLKTTVQANTPSELLTLLDDIASKNELSLQDSDKAVLWQRVQPQNTQFDFIESQNVFSATMTQFFKMYYLVKQIDENEEMLIKEVYLGQDGENHQLIATFSQGEQVTVPAS